MAGIATYRKEENVAKAGKWCRHQESQTYERRDLLIISQLNVSEREKWCRHQESKPKVRVTC